ncbi:sugar phosphate isomerase/epimerase [Saccharopolyspora rhizosphaerae]|uniref:Sugar phosphate isomerase/epimerase n=1 Tax=Saccharopolyspora rhizosphaerae TaxID=2492662 RepID=A0A426K373_9PSEU|nr:sugar phosphate isomerase/epimerase [Saccharopolyspora rhizosphaerae]RRO19967.1 sugar phosphate isomerase/epimerase [Saccharopolyspora rhizosphaerae]
MPTLSVQLYSVRDQIAADQPGTLARLAELGFRHVEPFGLGSLGKSQAERLAATRELRADLDAAGLAVSAVHAALPSVAELAEECAELGADTAFIPHPRQVPGFGENTFTDAAAVDAFADALGQAVAEAPDELALGYHNHWFEWAELPTGPAYDRFWQRTHRGLLAELDVYWAVAAGADPGEVLRALGDRVTAVHLKDGPALRDAPQTPLGSGALDVDAVLTAVAEIPWHVAEIDTTDLDPYSLLADNAAVLRTHGATST